MKPFLLLLPAALALGAAIPAPAETVFKWVDQNGVTNYTNTPPDSGGAGKVATVNATPPVESRYQPQPGVEEGQYWRQRRERELADSIHDTKLRQEQQELQQALLRQQLGANYDEEQRLAAEARRRQIAFDQCMFDRLPNCDAPSSYGGGGFVLVGAHPRPFPGNPPVVVRHGVSMAGFH
jgi:hypothetical protein